MAAEIGPLQGCFVKGEFDGAGGTRRPLQDAAPFIEAYGRSARFPTSIARTE